MEFKKYRQKWSLILGGLFFLSVCFYLGYVYHISDSVLLREQGSNITAVLFAGMIFIFVSGGLAIWIGIHQWEGAAIADHHNIAMREGDGKEQMPRAGEVMNDSRSRPSNATASGLMMPSGAHALEDRDTLESGMAHFIDLLEHKKIELEIRHQNKKVTESINYARRIQSAILPNMRHIHRALPDAFVLYKPRDIVSGDFPWFLQLRSEIFMAAVDCTGHGVPGALLSLVGYFLLNDIVKSRQVTDPGKILDLLDEGVSATLRPSEDAGTKDGMDISFCKINLETRQVEYAGAHRPLYVMKNGILEEIKGNRFPVGGGIFKNQTNFTTSRISLDSGDSIFFCTDGYCDQFGGPENKKFGVGQLRRIIGKVHSLPMKEALGVFEERWATWKGDQKQTDDVLLAGIKF